MNDHGFDKHFRHLLAPKRQEPRALGWIFYKEADSQTHANEIIQNELDEDQFDTEVVLVPETGKYRINIRAYDN